MLWSVFKTFGGHLLFLWGHRYIYFELEVISVLMFKDRVDPIACVLCRIYAMDSSDSSSSATPADYYWRCNQIPVTTLRCVYIDVTTRLTLRSTDIHRQQKRNEEKQTNREIESFQSLGNCWRKLWFFSDSHAHWTEKLKKHQQLL